MFENDVSNFAAFLAGLLSFFSPCVLPLIPAYLSYITGLSIEQYSSELSAAARRRIMLNTVFFILGFSFIFIIVFGAGTTLLSSAFKEHKDIIGKVGGVLIMIFGLHFLGVFKIKWLYREKRAHIKTIPAGYFGSFLVGIAFSAGWTPCVGPILASIIGMGLQADSQWDAIILLSFYTLGLAIPFFLTGTAINFFLPLFNKVKHHMRVVEVVTACLLIGVGALMFAGKSGVLMEYWPF
ncbi:MAG: cytochrome c biogenesis protein CcdA [Nitrospirae bacterium]|nr:cytochrome c biogenesis protein CcdA [Nitrospirota bacterium]MBI5695284.1 cytochrome c biogenesis protein CcdA [Nitrospirota bacterium]